MLFSAGSPIFSEGDEGDEAYLISTGVVDISRADTGGGALNLATLSSGALFGELSLIDDQPRSANAIAVKNTELVVLNRKVFWDKAHEDPAYVRSLLSILSKRLRDAGHRAFVYAHGSEDYRLQFFLGKVKQSASPSNKDPQNSVAKVTKENFAYMASTDVEQATKYLDKLQLEGSLKHTDKSITFYGQPTQ